MGGTGQVEDTELMTGVLKDLVAPRPYKYVLDLMLVLFSKKEDQ